MTVSAIIIIRMIIIIKIWLLSVDDQRHHHYHVYHHFRQLWAISSLAVREGIAQLEGIAAGDDDDVSTSRVLRDDTLDIDLV